MRALLELVAGEEPGPGVAKEDAEGAGGMKGPADNEEKDDIGKEGRGDGEEERGRREGGEILTFCPYRNAK